MRVLAVFDDKNYESHWKKYERNAVRAVIVGNGTIALVKSKKEGYYKFPGGGIEANETHMQALCRETLEEAGLRIKVDTIREMGMIREIRKSILAENEIFEQTSYYYFADVEDSITAVSLDEYEADLGFTLEWIDIRTAYETDVALGNRQNTKFILREAFVLGMLL